MHTGGEPLRIIVSGKAQSKLGLFAAVRIICANRATRNTRIIYCKCAILQCQFDVHVQVTRQCWVLPFWSDVAMSVPT